MGREFKSWQEYWKFSRSVKSSSRFIHGHGVQEFLKTLYETSKDRHRTFSKGGVVWRAQLGNAWREREQDCVSWDEEIPYAEERMKPLRGSAHEGRVNPKGIPCLYVASDRETATAEVRPWVGTNVSVGAFRTTRNLTLVDFSVGHNGGHPLFLEEPTGKEREEAVWKMVDRAFSTPVTHDDATAEYVPTQVIAEYFKKKGMDGLVYKSNLGNGFNLALFDLEAAELVACMLVPVKAVSFTYGDPMMSYRTATAQRQVSND